MNTQTLISLAISLSLIGGITTPAIAQSASGSTSSDQTMLVPTTSEPRPDGDSDQSQMSASRPMNNSILIPKSTGIIISFPANVAIDVGQDQDYPLTLPLAQAITDRAGNVIVPENSPVSVLLKPVDGGAQVVAQSMVVNGQIVPIQASSPVIPGTTITHMRANDRAVENGAVWGRMVGSTMGFMANGDPDRFDRGAMLGSAIGLVSGLRSPENTRVVQIPQGSVYVLALEAEVLMGL